MPTRRTFLVAVLAGPWLLPWNTLAQAPADEASLREALAEYERVWNRHGVKAWTAMLAPDVWYTEAASDFYERNKGRDKVVPLFSYNVENSDMKWEVKKLVIAPDGTATVAHRHTALILPKKDGQYASTFVSDPAASRWRKQDGRWQMFFFTSNKGWALDVMKKNGLE